MTIHDILSRLEGVKGGNGQWTACCPNHGDTHQSLSVAVGKDGRVLMKCHAGCAVGDIAQAIGLTVKDLFTEPQPAPRTGNTAEPRSCAGRINPFCGGARTEKAAGYGTGRMCPMSFT